MNRVIFVMAILFCGLACNNWASEQPPDQKVEKPVGGDANAKLPKFLTEDDFNCAMFAEAVNHFTDMGEATAIKSLKELAISRERNRVPARGSDTRLAFVCRVLFEPKGREPLRAPMFGGLAGLPYNTMPADKWRQFPVVHSGSSYFVLGEGYTLDGEAERCVDFVNYCCAEGNVRKERVPIPTKAQALRDFQALRKSDNWQALKWKDQGQGFQYELSEESVLEYLKGQADRTP